MEFLLSWVIGDKGNHAYCFSHVFLNERLMELKGSTGSVRLEIVDKEIGMTSLEVCADNHHYLITLIDDTEDGINVSSYFNGLAESSGMIEIHGDLWDRRQITQDFQIVLDTFSQFYLKGDINRESFI